MPAPRWIEDGENMMLTTRLGFLVQELYEDGWPQY